MQILNRAAGECISIGSEVTLCVVAVNGKSVRLGFEAPKRIIIHRSEIYEQIKDQKAGHLAGGPRAKD